MWGTVDYNMKDMTEVTNDFSFGMFRKEYNQFQKG
jgi:hypothetical protein